MKKKQELPISLQSYACSLWKLLVTGASQRILQKYHEQHLQLIDLLSKKVRTNQLKSADRFAWKMIQEIDVLRDGIILEDASYWKDSFPWQKAYKQFHTEIANAVKNQENQQQLLHRWKSQVPQWLLEKGTPQVYIQYSDKTVQAIRGFLFFFQEENFVKVCSNLESMQQFSWKKETTVEFIQTYHTWKLQYTKQEQQLALDHALATVDISILESIFHEIHTNEKQNHLLLFLHSPAFLKLKKSFHQPIFEEKPERGIFINLPELVHRIQKQWFPDMETMPTVCWIKKFTTRKVAHYHIVRDEIAFSLIFDSPDINIVLLEYLAYHELLHRELGNIVKNGKHYSHTQEFKRREKLFPNWEKYEKELSLYLRAT
ncbi:MAG: hypothetical protein ACI86H_000750 [bacterium]